MRYVRDQLGTEHFIVKLREQLFDCMRYHMDQMSLKSTLLESVNKSIDNILVCTEKRKIDASIIMNLWLGCTSRKSLLNGLTSNAIHSGFNKLFVDFWGEDATNDIDANGNANVKPQAIVASIKYASFLSDAADQHSKKYLQLAKALVTIVTTPTSQLIETEPKTRTRPRQTKINNINNISCSINDY